MVEFLLIFMVQVQQRIYVRNYILLFSSVCFLNWMPCLWSLENIYCLS